MSRPMTEAEILRRRKLRRAAIKRQKRRRTLFLYAFDKKSAVFSSKTNGSAKYSGEDILIPEVGGQEML